MHRFFSTSVLYICAVQQQSTASKTFAKFISILFHPVFIPTMVYAFLFLCCPELFFGIAEKSKSMWLIIIAYITITFPLLTVFLLWKLKFIESMEMHEMKERYGALIASMLFYFWTFWLFHKQFQAPMLLQSFLFGVFLTTVLLFMATIFFKISLHTGAWGGVVMFAIFCAFHQVHFALYFLIISVVIAGLVGSCRLYLEAHIKQQLYSGYVLGAIGQVLAYFLIKTFI